MPICSGAPHFYGDTVPSVPGAVMVDLRRMNKIIRIDRRNRIAIIESGVTYAEALLGFASLGFETILPVIFCVGMSIAATRAGLYAFAPLCYPAGIRSTGVGAAVSFGRLGTIAGPLFAGMLLSSGRTAAEVLIVRIPIILLGGIMTLPVARRIKRLENQA